MTAFRRSGRGAATGRSGPGCAGSPSGSRCGLAVAADRRLDRPGALRAGPDRLVGSATADGPLRRRILPAAAPSGARRPGPRRGRGAGGAVSRGRRPPLLRRPAHSPRSPRDRSAARDGQDAPPSRPRAASPRAGRGGSPMTGHGCPAVASTRTSSTSSDCRTRIWRPTLGRRGRSMRRRSTIPAPSAGLRRPGDGRDRRGTATRCRSPRSSVRRAAGRWPGVGAALGGAWRTVFGPGFPVAARVRAGGVLLAAALGLALVGGVVAAGASRPPDALHRLPRRSCRRRRSPSPQEPSQSPSPTPSATPSRWLARPVAPSRPTSAEPDAIRRADRRPRADRDARDTTPSPTRTPGPTETPEATDTPEPTQTPDGTAATEPGDGGSGGPGSSGSGGG